LRQRPSHYTIRAGRNLPDKELRYLRTVIVTAAVYWGFSSQLLPERMTAPFNLPAPSRCQSVYFVFRTWHRPVFLVNSCLDLFTAAPSCSGCEILHKRGALLIPKLRSQVAEFLNEGSLERLRILSSPTCVGLRYGHLDSSLQELFLGA